MPKYDTNSDYYSFDPNVSIEDIKEYFKKHSNGPYFSMFETGLNNLRFDLLRVNPFTKYIRVFEFKSCRNDFVRDKKWQKYLKYCHTLTFVCPAEVIQKQDLPPGIGLMWVYKWGHKSHQNTSFLDSEWIKRPKKRNVDQEIMLELAFTLVSRVRWRGQEVF